MSAMENIIPRLEYLKWLGEHRGKNLIKVLTGMRRTGKSTILRLFAESLRKEGVGERQIVFVNFDEIENEQLRDSRTLYAYLKSHLVKGKTVFFFLDEIQKVERFEEVLDSLYVKPEWTYTSQDRQPICFPRRSPRSSRDVMLK